MPLLFAGAVGIALLAFAEAIGPAEQFAKEHGHEIDANHELVALGSANMGAGLFRGFPIGASLSISAANDRVGATTPMSLVIAAIATMFVALFLTPLFEDLPEAALGAIVIVAVAEMERVEPLRRLWRLRRTDFALALVALFGVLIFDILAGLAIAVAASLGVVAWHAGHAHLRVMGATDTDVDTTTVEPSVAASRLLVLTPEQMMFFVNATEIRKTVVNAATNTDARPDVVVLDLALSPDLDVPALDALNDIYERLQAAGVRLWLAGLNPPVRDRLLAAGLVNRIGNDHLFNYVDSALAAYLGLHSSTADTARSEILTDLLHYIDTQRQHPALDPQGLQALNSVADRIHHELGARPTPE